MNLPLYIAKRYLFSKKSHQVINIISGVAISGVALATMAMVCTLSVFNGFKQMVAEQFTALDADIKITATQGKSIDLDSCHYKEIAALPCVDVASTAVEEKAMIQYGGRQVMANVKGVDDNFAKLTNIESSLLGGGQFILQDSINSYAVPGIGIIGGLNCGLYHTAPLEVYTPRRGSKVSISNPAANFKKGYLFSSGVTFSVNQPKYDEGYILTSAHFARELFGRSENEATSIEIKLAEGYDDSDAKKEIAAICGKGLKIENRYEQQKEIFKVMTVEKFISYIFLSFILLIACFNIIGTLSMLIIEKRENMETLRALGASDDIIGRIFIIEGSIISATGAVGGILIGIILCLAQQEFGFLTLGSGDAFITSSYPVKLEIQDILVTFGTVVAVGLTAVWLPVRLLTKRFLAGEK